MVYAIVDPARFDYSNRHYLRAGPLLQRCRRHTLLPWTRLVVTPKPVLYINLAYHAWRRGSH